MTRPLRIEKSARGIWEPVITEEMVVKEIMARLTYAGARVNRVVERIPWGRTKSQPGIPDLFGWVPAKHTQEKSPDGVIFYTSDAAVHFFIEVKRKGGKLRPAQAAWLDQAQADGVIAFKAESWEEVRKEMAVHGISLPA